SSLYVLYQVDTVYHVDAVPRIVAPFFGSPAVYVTVAVVAGAVWAGTAGAELPINRWTLPSVPGIIALAGSIVAAGVVGWTLFTGGKLTVFWPTIGLIIAAVLAAIVWTGLRQSYPETEITGAVGALCVFGHTLDGVSTAVGLDILGLGEQSPISQAIIEFAAGLPTATIIGSGWLFVLVKLALAAVVVILLSGYVREEPAEGYLLLGAVAAVGLGPGVHNLLLFSIVSP
ncbi:MAG TPA: DUF63 family protein, partial [Halococcus sp.]|nr:DUF63 family protein [Halococcus sp.]